MMPGAVVTHIVCDHRVTATVPDHQPRPGMIAIASGGRPYPADFQRRRPSDPVPHTIGVPLFVTPGAPATSQKEPGCTVPIDGAAGAAGGGV